MIKMKFLIYLFTIFFNFQYFANSQSLEMEYKISKPPLCTNNNGKNVYFKNLNSKTGMFPAGVAKKDINGLPVIYRFNYQKAPKSLQIFIDFHECAHHQIGDIDRPHPPRNSYEHLMNESIADCIAILRVRDEEESNYESYENLITSLEKDMKHIGFPVISISSRISNISNCYKNYGSAKSFIAGVIEKRGLE